MRRGTTPQLTLTVDTDLTDYDVFVTLKGGASIVTLQNNRLNISVENDVSTITFTLTQDETLSFGVTSVEVQVRAVHDGAAIATDIQKVDVKRILLDGKIGGSV